MAQSKYIKVTVRCFDPEKGGEPYLREYEVPLEEGMSVTNALYRINEISGEAVAYRVSCHRGLCASCLMRVNGRVVLGCCVAVVGDIMVEPAFPNRVIKDLVIIQA